MTTDFGRALERELQWALDQYTSMDVFSPRQVFGLVMEAVGRAARLAEDTCRQLEAECDSLKTRLFEMQNAAIKLSIQLQDATASAVRERAILNDVSKQLDKTISEKQALFKKLLGAD